METDACEGTTAITLSSFSTTFIIIVHFGITFM
jgi:hypothetical protein